MGISAIITAGDQRAAKAVYGESKVFLQIAGLPMVARVVLVLQQVPEIDAVWVVGNSERLEGVFADADFRARIVKPLHVVEQFRNLFENCWETFRRQLPGAGPSGRDPEGDEDLDTQVLYVSGDLPFATPEEISDFIRSSQETGCDYAVGLVPRESLQDFLPTAPGGPGIEVAYFAMREGRLRQSNLHLARPARMGARHLIEDMYEQRHQRRFGNMLGLGWQLLVTERAGLLVVFRYFLIHMGGLADRWGFTRLADRLRQHNTLERTEQAISQILRTRFRFVITELGGCAIDVDTEEEFDAVVARFDEWQASQAARAKALRAPALATGKVEGGARE